MGYFLISKGTEKPFEVYVNRMEELIYQIEGDLEDVVVVHGSRDNEPYFLKNSKEFKNFCSQKYRIGINAQDFFVKMAKENKFIVEAIPQDQDSYKDYCVLDSISVKRADYNIRNCSGLEVDVKCLTFYKVNKEECFYIKYKEVMGFERMRSLCNNNTVLAIFKQKNKMVEDDSLIMIELSKILEENNRSVSYDNEKKCLIVPVSLATPGFELLEEHRINNHLYR